LRHYFSAILALWSSIIVVALGIEALALAVGMKLTLNLHLGWSSAIFAIECAQLSKNLRLLDQ
jgi:hypothetical protein